MGESLHSAAEAVAIADEFIALVPVFCSIILITIVALLVGRSLFISDKPSDIIMSSSCPVPAHFGEIDART